MPWFVIEALANSPVVLMPLYVFVMSKMEIISVRKHHLLYIPALLVIFLFSLHCSQDYLVPKLNEAIYGFPGHRASLLGLGEDIAIQLLVLTPLYLGLTKLIPTSVKNRKWHVIYFLIYYFVSYAPWRLHVYLLKGLINYGGF